MPAAHELIAHNRSELEVAKAIGAERLIFQDLEDLEAAVRRGNLQLNRFDTSCFTGEYVTGDIDAAYLNRLEQKRSDHVKTQHASDASKVVDLHAL
jgi:amidophosphoribosyltransferase